MAQRASRREWSRLVMRWRSSGKTSKEFAGATGLNASTLLWWSSRLRSEQRLQKASGTARRAGNEPSFAEVALAEVGSGVGDDRFELELGSGRRLRIPAGFDALALERLLAVLK